MFYRNPEAANYTRAATLELRLSSFPLPRKIYGNEFFPKRDEKYSENKDNQLSGHNAGVVAEVYRIQRSIP